LTEQLVLDASAMVAMLVGGPGAQPIVERLGGASIHVPAHFDAEVLSALGRLQRAGQIDAATVERGLDALARAPFKRHGLASLVGPAWARHEDMRLVDALYIALAADLGAPIITLDRGLAEAAIRAELIRL
jgi:predicted nucleic acid-binding protein